MSELHERVFFWLSKKSKGSATGKIRCTGILARLCTEIINDPVSLRKALMFLRAEGKIEYAAGQHGEPVGGYMTVILPKEETPRHILTWLETLASSGLEPPDQTALRPIGSSLTGFTPSDMSVLLTGLTRLRADQSALFGQQIFNISAAYLMGSSKLLSVLDSRALRAFGIEIDRFPPRPSYIVVGGNTITHHAVVLIENPVAFETAVESPAAEHCLFVCTFGFGLSASANDYGYQLAGAVESGNAIVLNRSHGISLRFGDILGHHNIQFWGDLDMAGMQIFCRLVAKVPHIKLSALYRPMLEAIKKEGSRHPYVMAVGKDGQRQMLVQSDRTDVLGLLADCARHAVDQELVSINELSQLAGKAL